jgi:hypothetical protein
MSTLATPASPAGIAQIATITNAALSYLRGETRIRGVENARATIGNRACVIATTS